MRFATWFSATVLVVAVAGCAPRAASWAGQQGTLSVRVRVDRDASGRLIPTYAFSEVDGAGELIRFSVDVAVDAYVYLFDVAADGIVRQFFPNRVDGIDDALVQASRGLRVPPEGARYRLSVEPPYGVGRVIALASRVPLDTRTLASLVDARPAAASPGTPCGDDCVAADAKPFADFERALAIIVQPLASWDWGTDVVRYRVQPR